MILLENLDGMDSLFAAMSVGGILTYIAIIVLLIVAQWKVFEKAGQPGWASLIPIYSTIVMLEIVGKPWYWIFLLMIPGVNIIFAIWMLNLLSKSFGHGVGFTLGLLFFGLIFLPILGFGDSKYIGPAGATTN